MLLDVAIFALKQGKNGLVCRIWFVLRLLEPLLFCKHCIKNILWHESFHYLPAISLGGLDTILLLVFDIIFLLLMLVGIKVCLIIYQILVWTFLFYCFRWILLVHKRIVSWMRGRLFFVWVVNTFAHERSHAVHRYSQRWLALPNSILCQDVLQLATSLESVAERVLHSPLELFFWKDGGDRRLIFIEVSRDCFKNGALFGHEVPVIFICFVSLLTTYYWFLRLEVRLLLEMSSIHVCRGPCVLQELVFDL